MTEPTRSEEPQDHLGYIANAMIDTMESHDPDVRAVVFLEDTFDRMCMTALHGWETDLDAVVAVIAHLTKVFEANGKTLMIVPLGKG